MTTIKAPFNFVPLNDKVFFPDWADKVSHDIPFEDGESGVIEYTITAESPIFVRNGHTKKEAEDKTNEYASFSKIKDKYFIPGTSIKGAIRGVLEIISFGKMNQINDHRYGLRDLQLKREYLNFFLNSDVHCGWMRQEGEQITISDCGIPKRISHKNIDDLWGTNFSKMFKDSQLLKNDDNRTALYKINLSKGKNKRIRYNEFLMNSVNSVDKRIVANVDPSGKYEGLIVLTGQPSARKDKGDEHYKNGRIIKEEKGSGKCYEFVFPIENSPQTYTFNQEDNTFKDFCFIYKDSDDWKYWKLEMKKGNLVPVFFSLANNQLLHFGLSYLYKLPYKNRIKDCLPEEHKSTKLDLSECIFGTSLHDPLRGRVQVSHGFLEAGSIDEEQKLYMGSPKSSYYPIYIQQNGNKGYVDGFFTTMMSDNARLKGWKRYPVRDEIMENSIPKGQEENAAPFIPMKAGAQFKGSIHFHNLKEIELGAILKSINFSKTGFHTIGYAKSHGYGKIKFNITLTGCRKSEIEYIETFVSFMKNKYPDYIKSPQLNQLFQMSVPQDTISPLEYMELEEFVKCKRQNPKKDILGEYLEYYSQLVKKTETNSPSQELLAEVTFSEKGLTKVKLIDSKEINSKVLKDVDRKIKLKPGDTVLVKSSNKKDELIFLKKQ